MDSWIPWHSCKHSHLVFDSFANQILRLTICKCSESTERDIQTKRWMAYRTTEVYRLCSLEAQGWMMSLTLGFCGYFSQRIWHRLGFKGWVRLCQTEEKERVLQQIQEQVQMHKWRREFYVHYNTAKQRPSSFFTFYNKLMTVLTGQWSSCQKILTINRISVL